MFGGCCRCEKPRLGGFFRFGLEISFLGFFGNFDWRRRKPAQFTPAIDDAAEQVCCLFRVVGGGVGFLVAEGNARQFTGLGQHGVAVGEARQGSGIKRREWMKKYKISEKIVFELFAEFSSMM